MATNVSPSNEPLTEQLFKLLKDLLHFYLFNCLNLHIVTTRGHHMLRD